MTATTVRALLLEGEIRPTKARLTLLELLVKAGSPKTTQELLDVFPGSIHKVTIYRDLSLLVSAGLVEEQRFNERAARYQLVDHRHSHSLVCESCGVIDKIELPHDLDRQESQIAQQKKFLVNKHALEFYGICAACQH